MSLAQPDSRWNRTEFLQVSGTILILLLLRIPALTGPPNLHTDATEYIDIARNIAAGEGPVLKIRSYFFNDGFTLPYPAAPLRSILFPLLMGGFYSIFQSNLVFQWFNFGIFSINIILLALILRRVVAGWMLPYSLLLAGLCEPLFLTSIFPGAEQTALLWLLLAMLMGALELHKRWGLIGAAAEGVVGALAAMSRPEYALVGILFLAWLWIKERRAATCMSFLVGFLVPLSALYMWNYQQYGRIFITSDYLFRSRHYKSYFSLEAPGTDGSGRFFWTNIPWIASRILRNALNYAGKLIGWKNLFLLAAALPPVLMNMFREPSTSWRKLHLALVPTAFFIGYSLVWSTLDRERFLVAITPFWIPLCVMEVNQWRLNARRPWVRTVAVVILFMNLPLFLANVIHADFKIQHRTGFGERFYAKNDLTWSNPDVPAITAWIQANTGADDVLCIENPFMLNYLTGRPSLMLPENADAANFLALLKTYKVRYWIDNPVYTNRPAGLLNELRQTAEKAGSVQVVRCGTYEIWKIRS